VSHAGLFIDASSADNDAELSSCYPALIRELGSVFRRRGAPLEESRDLAQETIARALVHLKRHGRTRNDLRPLVHTIARNLWVERARRAKMQFVALNDAHEVVDEAPQPVEQVLAQETSKDVDAAVASLSPRHRRVVALWMQGLTPLEIARELGIKRNAADALLHRVKRRLAAQLDPGRATLGILGLFVLRLRAGVRRVVDSMLGLDPSGSFASAAGGLAAVGIVAALAVSGAATQAAARSVDARPVVSVAAARSGPGIATSDAASRIAASAAVRESRRDIASAGTEITNPTTGKQDEVGVEFWYNPDDGDVVMPAVDAAVGKTCGISSSSCAR
jgi:RNA polymerase sigma-70 factor, ECF subfamily